MTSRDDEKPARHPFDEALRAAFELREDEGRDRAPAAAGRSTGSPAGAPHPAEAGPTDPSAGFEESDRYAIKREVGRGGVGIVLEGTDRVLGRDVAIKTLHERYASNTELVRRFIEEAKVGGQLEHPGIVPVHDIVTSDAGRPFFTMKLVKGDTLATLLARRASPAEDRARFHGIFQRICQTMAYAHDRGVIHRDLKPANIMVGDFGEVQVMDWGLAKVITEGESPADASVEAAGDHAALATRVGSVMGTPAYMPPEQARGDVERVDTRADVFALGAILCEILTGSPPYAGDSSDEVLHLATAGDLRACLAALDAADVDEDVKRITLACLETDLSHRARDAGIVADAINVYLASVQHRLDAARIAAARAEARATAERRARRMTVVAATTVLIALVVGAGAFYWSEENRRQRTDRVLADIRQATSETEELIARARAAEDPATGTWAEAEATAERARVLARSDDVDAAERDRVVRLFERVSAAKAQAEVDARRQRTDARMVRTLESIRVAAPLYWTARNGQYTRAFRAYGLDVLETPAPEAATRIAASPIKDALIAAINDWLPVQVGKASAADTRRKLGALIEIVDPDSGRRRIRDLIAANDFEGLKEAAREIDPKVDSLGTILHTSMFLGRRGAFADAIELLRRTYRVHPHDFWVLLELARWLQSQTTPEALESLSFMRAAVALRPTMSSVQMSFGQTLELLGRFEEAEEAIERALRLDADNADAHAAMAQLSNKTKGPHAAAKHMREACRLRPDDAYLRVRLGSYLIHTHPREAVAVLGEVIQTLPDSAIAHCWLSEACNAIGHHRKAMKHAETALELWRKGRQRDAEFGTRSFHAVFTVTDASRQIANACLSLREFRRALALFRSISDPAAPALIARCLSEMGDHERAIAALESEAVEHGRCRWDFGLVLTRAARYAEAVPHLEEAARTPSALKPGLRPRAYIAGVEEAARAARRFETVLRGESTLTDVAETSRFAAHCHRRGLHARAARTWAVLFAEHDATIFGAGISAMAAGAAAAAGTGRGTDAAGLDAEERRRLRKRAREWMDQCLDLMPSAQGVDPADRSVWNEFLRTREHVAFAGVREPEVLAKLPPAERKAFRAMWQRVDRLADAYRATMK